MRTCYGRYAVWPTLLFAAVVASAADAPCPETMSGMHADGLYRFEYKSWSWLDRASSGRTFCSCLRNKNATRSLFIDWERVGLSGFVAPGDTAYTYETYETESELKENSKLWYGSQPAQKQVPVTLPQSVVRTSRSSDGAWFAIRPVQYREPTPASKVLRSESKISIPSYEAIRQLWHSGGGSTQALISVIENQPQALVSMRFEFMSEPVIEEKSKRVSAIRQICRYIIDDGPPTLGAGGGYTALIKDPELHAAIFKSKDPVQIEAWGGKAVEYSGQFEKVDEAIDGLRRKRTQVELLSPNGAVIAKMPITFYAK